MRMMPELGIHA